MASNEWYIHEIASNYSDRLEATKILDTYNAKLKRIHDEGINDILGVKFRELPEVLEMTQNAKKVKDAFGLTLKSDYLESILYGLIGGGSTSASSFKSNTWTTYADEKDPSQLKKYHIY